MSNILNNLIDILKLRTFILEQYSNNIEEPYYDYNSIQYVTSNIEYLNSSKILHTTCKNFTKSYNIPNTFTNNTNNLDDIIIFMNSKKKPLLPNQFSISMLSIHYPTHLLSMRYKITIHFNYLSDNYKQSISNTDLEYKIFYDKTKFDTNKLFISYLSTNQTATYEKVYRKVLIN